MGCGRVLSYVMRRIFLSIFLALAVAGGVVAAPSTSRPSTTRPAASRPLTPEEQKAQKVRELTRKSLELFKTKDYAKVEEALTEALVLDPEHSTNIYNMA